jgi:C_GCAxxG_C_C family probable redox protein
MSDKSQEAKEIFLSGFSCSQAVFVPFCSENLMSRETALKLSSPFGGGVGGCGHTCGAVSGAYLAIGLVYGRAAVEDTAAKEKTYTAMAVFREEFEKSFGTLICSELVGVDMSDSVQRLKAREEGKLANCSEFVRRAAEILEDIL